MKIHRLRYGGCSHLLILLIILAVPILSCDSTDHFDDRDHLGEQPGIIRHISNTELEMQSLSLEEVLEIGKEIFTSSFNTLDGAGNSKLRLTDNQVGAQALHSRFNRVSGPDANACSGCHNLPIIGGGGDNVANVFVLAHRFPDVNFDSEDGDLFEQLTLTTVGNERGTISMFGSGLIELLAREMTLDLHHIRDQALENARSKNRPVTVPAETKGVTFGKLTAWPDGLIDASDIVGVDEDLVIKPFSQKGVYTSLREFTLDSLALHHGIQAEERVGTNVDGDLDGITNELTMADITGLILFQASLPPPAIIAPLSRLTRDYAGKGEGIFESIGCVECHKPFLELNDPVYTEPNPFNPPGTPSGYSIPERYQIDLSIGADPTTLRPTKNGTYLVYAYTDLKRHNMGPLLANETIEQRFVESPFWITRKLWGIMSEPPFLHHGRATLLDEAIVAHGGEAESSRNNYQKLPLEERSALIEFIKSFRIDHEIR